MIWRKKKSDLLDVNVLKILSIATTKLITEKQLGMDTEEFLRKIKVYAKDLQKEIIQEDSSITDEQAREYVENFLNNRYAVIITSNISILEK